MRANLKTSFRDLLITSWLIIFGVTTGMAAIHPAYRVQGLQDIAIFIGLPAIGMAGGILLTLYVNRLCQAASRTRKIALSLFVASMLALIPVMWVIFAMPWAALMVLTLLYTRWKWALVATTD